jgi:5'-3' exonuclease
MRGNAVAVDSTFLDFRNWQAAIVGHISSLNLVTQDVNREAIIQRWKDVTLYNIRMFVSSGVTPVFCYDGPAPPEKKQTQTDRISKSQKAKQEYNELMAKRSEVSPFDNITEMDQRLKKTVPYVLYRTKQETEEMKNTLRSWGFTVLTSNTEGEKLCASLVIAKQCSAVYTNDTDVLCHGAAYMIKATLDNVDTQINNQYYSTRNVTIVSLQNILIGLNINFQSFQHLCFMLGCDYNNRIHRVGPVKCMNSIAQYGLINNMPFDTSCLNLNDCTRLFTPVEPHLLTDETIPSSLKWNYSSCKLPPLLSSAIKTFNELSS